MPAELTEEPTLLQLVQAVSRLPVACATFDSSGRVTSAMGGGFALMGLRPEDTVGVSLLGRFPLAEDVRAALEGRETSSTLELDGRWWQYHVAPLPDRTGGCLLGTEAVEPEAPVQVVASAPVCITAFDSAGVITHASGSGYAALGLDPQDTLDRSVADLYGDSQVIVESVTAVLAGHDSDLVVDYHGRRWDLHYRALIDAAGVVTGGLCTGQDITAWSPETSPLPSAAMDPKVDLLTGLLSRQAVAELLMAGSPTDEAAAVLVDLDAFAVLNEAHGHAAGDVVLVAVAERLRRLAGVHWDVGRWGDDVFALVRRAPGAPAEAEALVTRIGTAVAQPVDDGAARLQVTASIGLATTAEGPMSGLLAAAAEAVRSAKQSGRDQVHRYTAREAHAPATTPRLTAELQLALERNEIGLHYQPVVRLADRVAVGVEALARWSHPQRGMLQPAHFIPLAERSGLIIPLGERLLREACHTAATWQRTPPTSDPLTVAINLSAGQLTHPGLVAMVRNALAVSGCDPRGLAVEVTETAVMDDLDVAVGTLSALKDLGLGIALDDFGTGYSSLVYLKRFPVDTLKIDRSFVAGLGHDSNDSAIVASLVSLAHSVGVGCVAEGVETAEQLAILESLGCDQAQGYVFGRAMDPAGVATWLGRQRRTTGSRRAARPAVPSVEAATLDRVLALHREGASLHTIAARLNVEGRRTAKGTRWHHTTVAQVIAATVSRQPATARRGGPPARAQSR